VQRVLAEVMQGTGGNGAGTERRRKPDSRLTA